MWDGEDDTEHLPPSQKVLRDSAGGEVGDAVSPRSPLKPDGQMGRMDLWEKAEERNQHSKHKEHHTKKPRAQD